MNCRPRPGVSPPASACVLTVCVRRGGGSRGWCPSALLPGPGAGQAAQNLDFLLCFPRVAQRLCLEHPGAPCPWCLAGSASSLPRWPPKAWRTRWGSAVGLGWSGTPREV